GAHGRLPDTSGDRFLILSRRRSRVRASSTPPFSSGGLRPPDPLHALSRAASPARSVRVARSLRSPWTLGEVCPTAPTDRSSLTGPASRTFGDALEMAALTLYSTTTVSTGTRGGPTISEGGTPCSEGSRSDRSSFC